MVLAIQRLMDSLLSALLLAVLAGTFAVGGCALLARFHPLIDLMGQFLLPAMIAAAAVLLVALLAGRYGVALASIAALLFNFALASPWLKNPARIEARGPRIQLLLLNVFYRNPRLD